MFLRHSWNSIFGVIGRLFFILANGLTIDLIANQMAFDL